MATNDFLDHNEKVRLLNSLNSMTQRGIISWEADPGESDKARKRDDAFIAVLEPSFGFYLSSIDRDGVAPYRLAIFRRQEKDEDTTGPIAIIQMTALDEDGDEEVNHLVDDLYTEVVRRVRRPDEAIRELFQVLDRIAGEPPF